MAIGVLMASTPHWTEDDAEEAFQRAAAQRRRGARDVATHVIRTGTLP